MFAPDIVAMLKQKPFVPFRIITHGDKTYDVKHPDAAIVSLGSTHVGETPGEGDAFTRIHVINNQAIIRLEPLTAKKSKS